MMKASKRYGRSPIGLGVERSGRSLTESRKEPEPDLERHRQMKHSNLRQKLTKSVFITRIEKQRITKAFQTADIELLQTALVAFGGVKGASSWLTRPALGLSGKIPLFHAQTQKGKAEVLLLMNRIDRGIAS